ncbi:MAG: methyltransferase domain-containing protein [Rhizobiales bacterium]|nr:methyltransferase domain-containing protein [Hyphomicrobiales bacterium]
METDMKDDVLDTHYTRLANDYNDFLHYSPTFVRALTSKMIEKLQLKEDDTLVDLGCGTCIYSLDILRQIPLKQPVIGVDPYPEMLAKIPDGAPIRPIAMDGLEFSKRPGRYDKILIKEAIHHVAERDELFGNLYQRLSPGGTLLLVHVPPNVQYPLFQKALERCLTWHADPNKLTAQLQRAGFQVGRDAVEFTHAIPKQRYFKMVQSCYMSALTSLSEDELRAGLVEMENKYRDLEILEFVDHFDYLTAIRD